VTAATHDEPAETSVAELSYTAASRELDEIVAFFEQGDLDIDQLVGRLERATAIVDELDRRLRRTRAQVQDLVPRLESAVASTDRDGAPQSDEPPDDDAPGLF
jgi:exodeoxyribonuclease VII small subunit